MRIETIDLNFLGTEHIIASFLLLGERDAALVETGPTTCIEYLKRGLEDHGVSYEDVLRVFLTHIHLDHAGASGHLAELLPNATFYVHEVGYPHLVDPSKLLKSATRIYGERMDELWGETHPVPKGRVEILKGLKGGEELEAAGGVLAAHYTPGHAYHHLAYLEPDSGALFTGDVAGIRLPGQSYVRPPTPPPEIDMEAWVRSLEDIRRIAPRSLWPTHFGRLTTSRGTWANWSKGCRTGCSSSRGGWTRVRRETRSPTSSRSRATPRCSPRAPDPKKLNSTIAPATTRRSRTGS